MKIETLEFIFKCLKNATMGGLIGILIPYIYKNSFTQFEYVVIMLLALIFIKLTDNQ